jgi:uncharacterized protein
MSRNALEDMERISRKVGHVMIATTDRKGIPHIAAASKITVVSDNEVRVDGWFCSKTVQNLRENPNIALVVWDREFDRGFQLIGQCRNEKDIAVLDGFAPGMEERENIPQFERELSLKVNSILEFKRALHNDLEEVKN